MLACLLALAGAFSAPQADVPPPAPLRPGIAVAWTGQELTDAEFGTWIGRSLGNGHEAVQEALRHLLQIRLVESEAAARGFRSDAAAVEARFAEARAALENAGLELARELTARGMSEAEFRKLLGDSLLHEQLVRADLGLAADAAVSAEQLQAWSDQRLADLLAAPTPAAPDLALAAGIHRITRAELGEVLLRTTPAQRLRELAGQRALEQALPAWGAARGLTLPDAVLLEEVEWRRRRVAENPNYQGATYEGLLAARGITLEDVLSGAELRVTGWLRLYTAELWSDAWFDALPAEEHRVIEEEFGATREVSWLLLHAKPEKASELDLTPAEAAAELRAWSAQVTDAASFGALAGKYSEHAPSQRQNGRLGLVHAVEPGMDPLLVAAAFDAPVGALHGPVTVQGGVALLWIHSERKAPDEAGLRAAYRRARHDEAQQHFLDAIGLRTRWDEPARE
jgi:hypothetical protein